VPGGGEMLRKNGRKMNRQDAKDAKKTVASSSWRPWRLGGSFSSIYPVTAPSLAECTVFAYFASTPRFSLGGGAFHAPFRLHHSPSLSFASTRFASASIVTTPPSFSSAIGPPVQASGQTWPTTRPWVPPLKRPSVIRPTDS